MVMVICFCHRSVIYTSIENKMMMMLMLMLESRSQICERKFNSETR